MRPPAHKHRERDTVACWWELSRLRALCVDNLVLGCLTLTCVLYTTHRSPNSLPAHHDLGLVIAGGGGCVRQHRQHTQQNASASQLPTAPRAAAACLKGSDDRSGSLGCRCCCWTERQSQWHNAEVAAGQRVDVCLLWSWRELRCCRWVLMPIISYQSGWRFSDC